MARECRVIVLNLHSVSPKPSLLEPRLAPEVFAQLVEWMTPRLRIVTFGQLAEERSWTDDRPMAVLSFDDGYRDFVEYAMPILARYGVRANQNVIPGCVEAQRPPWNVHLLRVLEQIPADRAAKIRFPSLSPDVYWDRSNPALFGLQVSRYIKNRSKADRDVLIQLLSEQLPELMEPLRGEMMSVNDVRVAAEEHELGLHSFDHDSMEFETDDFFRQDLAACVRWSEQHLAVSPGIYAFPNGSYRPSQIKIATDAGMEHVLLVGERSTARESAVRSRVTVFGSDVRELRTRLARAA